MRKREPPAKSSTLNKRWIDRTPYSRRFQGRKLEAQLDEQGRAFLRDTSKNHLDAVNKTLYLSKIFDWFKGDFTAKSGTVEKFITSYVSNTDRKVIAKGGGTIKYTDYN